MGKHIPKREQREVQEAVQEMQHVDREARKPDYSKDKARRRKQELKKYLRGQGVDI